MAQKQPSSHQLQAGPDSIGCVGMILLLGFAIILLTAMFRNHDSSPLVAEADSPATQSGTPVREAAAPVAVTSTPHPTNTLPPLPTITNTATATSAGTATWIPTNTWTPTAAPPTEHPPTVGPPTPEPLPLLPTATHTPMPLPTPVGTISWTLRVPMLMYHYISSPPEDADKYRLDLSVEPDIFRAQMAYLAENGYTTIDLYDLSLAIVARQPLPDKPVIITIDDGYVDNYQNAFPVLQAYGQTATFFIITDFVDRGAAAYATWPMLEEMAHAGMRLEPHTKTHPDLRERSQAFLVWEILGAQETLAAHIGYTPRYLAYPSGRYDELVLQTVEQLDFWGAVTTEGGWWHGFNDRYEWKRLRVRHSTTMGEFIELLEDGQ